MNKKVSLLYFFCFICLVGFLASATSCKAYTPKIDVLRQTEMSPKVYKLALKAHKSAIRRGEVANPDIMTVIDYSKPSYEKRMWVIDLKNKSVLHHTYVSHGVATGHIKAQKFSNIPGSKQSSLGVFKTGDIYVGKHGRSLNLHGLEKQFNANAYNRRIVIHGASYVGEERAKRKSVGRSHGCPAVANHLAGPIINTIKNGTLLFIYYPDAHWLNKSSYLA